MHDLGLEARIGVNTGEVVAVEGESLVVGDAVNVAARLEQSAASGDVLLGETTANLVRDAVTTELLELSLRGKPNPVTAYQLVTLDAAATVSPVTSTDRWSAVNVSWTGLYGLLARVANLVWEANSGVSD